MFDDLRGLIQKSDEIGQLTKVEGADGELEMGTINELMVERKKPILLFDKVKLGGRLLSGLGERWFCVLEPTARMPRVACEVLSRLDKSDAMGVS